MEYNNENIVTGWRLQSLADATIIFNENCNVPYFAEQNIKYVLKDDISSIKELKTIFVYTHDLDNFFEQVYPQLDQFILITHNSDHGITNKYVRFLEETKIIKWYAQNAYIYHSKLQSLPIGIANERWKHGNINELVEVINRDNKKDSLVYTNFNNDTNINERNHIEQILKKNSFVKSDKEPFIDYLNTISKNFFAVAPPGNGIDCHRIWECLYLRTVPVVREHPCFFQWQHLPILFIKNWEEVTLSFLESKVYTVKNNQNIQELNFLYWKKLIKQNL